MTAPTALPYGLRDTKLTPYLDAAGTTLGTTSIDLPNMQTLSFEEAEEFTTLRGDDKLIATHGQGAQVEWELEAGGISLVCWALFTGGDLVETGIAPNRIWQLRKRATAARPYFKIHGRVINDLGGDVQAVIYRAKCNENIGGQFGDGEFFVSNLSGLGLPLSDDVADFLYEVTIYETATPLTTTPLANPTLQAAPTTLANGTMTATTAPLTWVAAAGAVLASDYKVQRKIAFGDWTDATVTSATTTGATVTGLVTATQYQFRVRAVTAANGASNWSNTITATTA